MTNFIGDYIGKIDAKGRFVFPSPFKKQMDGVVNRFVVKKDIFENCLVLYPYDEWKRQVAIIRKRLNPYNKTHNLFLRKFYKDTVEVSLDSAGRLLVPKNILQSANIEREVVFVGQDDKIELWNKLEYEKVDISQQDFARLAEDIFNADIENEFDGIS
jgi:MraZ protein